MVCSILVEFFNVFHHFQQNSGQNLYDKTIVDKMSRFTKYVYYSVMCELCQYFGFTLQYKKCEDFRFLLINQEYHEYFFGTVWENLKRNMNNRFFMIFLYNVLMFDGIL